MDFAAALTRMRDWLFDLENYITSKDELAQCYEAAIWIRDCRPSEDRERGLLRGPKPRYEPRSLATLATLAAELCVESEQPFRRRQVYAGDIAAADFVIRHIESHAAKGDRQLIRLLASHESTRSAARKLGISKKGVRNRRDAAWIYIKQQIDAQPLAA
jgi:hypothetical protein